MKKIISIFLLVSLIFVNCSCTKKEEPEKPNTPVTSEEEIVKEPTYVDDNPVTLGLYTRNSTTGYHYIESDIYLPWNQYVDIEVFKVLPTHDSVINYWYMQDAFPHYWQNYENNSKYKIGFNLSYKTIDGESFSWNIINPSDKMNQVFNFVQLYVYDDIHPAKGSWYDHLEDNEMTEGVIFTSIKLCASTFINNIQSPMQLTVFSYDSSDDFDPTTGLYRGNSYHTINIYKTN